MYPPDTSCTEDLPQQKPKHPEINEDHFKKTLKTFSPEFSAQNNKTSGSKMFTRALLVQICTRKPQNQPQHNCHF